MQIYRYFAPARQKHHQAPWQSQALSFPGSQSLARFQRFAGHTQKQR
jgi:hypothetical protein